MPQQRVLASMAQEMGKESMMGDAINQDKLEKVMHEYKKGGLHSGKGGKIVKSRKQAVAIALNSARKYK